MFLYSSSFVTTIRKGTYLNPLNLCTARYASLSSNSTTHQELRRLLQILILKTLRRLRQVYKQKPWHWVIKWLSLAANVESLEQKWTVLRTQFLMGFTLQPPAVPGLLHPPAPLTWSKFNSQCDQIQMWDALHDNNQTRGILAKKKYLFWKLKNIAWSTPRVETILSALWTVLN